MIFLDNRKQRIRVKVIADETHLCGEDLDNKMVERCHQEF